MFKKGDVFYAILFKYYGRHKQYWHYGVENAGLLSILIKKAKGLPPSKSEV